MKKRMTLVWLMSVILPWAVERAEAASLTDFADFSLRSGTTTLLPGRLYVPPASIADPSTPRPFIVFLHGAGESGTNNSAQVNGNIDQLLAEAKRRNAFLYAPQTNGGWATTTVLDRIKTMIDRAEMERPIDPNRLYVTGLSMGGGGTWNMVNRYGDLFAAAVPICAVSPMTGFVPSRLLDDAIWAFHARDDGTVSNVTTRNVISSILTAGQQPLPMYPVPPVTADFEFISPTLDLRHTEYRIGGHGIWGRVYNTPAMYQWLFAHTTAVPEPSVLTSAMLAIAILGARHRRKQQAALVV